MYDRFVELYDYIFPYKPAQRAFVLRHSTGRDSLLDIGCSTGALADVLSKEFTETIAIDYSAEMVQKAQERESAVSYAQGDMRALSETIERTFDVITCFGNTLVHLNSEEEIKKFFKDVKSLLGSEGVFLFQIVNYNRILRERPSGLPTIDNEHITFVRNYHYDALPHVRFETQLLDKASGEKITGEVPLLAIESHTIERLLKESGFADVQLFGSFTDDSFAEDSFPLVVKAQ